MSFAKSLNVSKSFLTAIRSGSKATNVVPKFHRHISKVNYSSIVSRSIPNATVRANTVSTTNVRSYYGESDQNLKEFLTSEIQAEKEGSHALPKLEGFTVEKSNGAEIVMSKKMDGETIRIRTNVNNSMDDDSLGESDESQAQMVCRPPMIIEITKDAYPHTLCISCEFPHPSDMENDQEFVDTLEIRELLMLKQGEEWKGETYTVAGSVLDGTLYDLLISMLEERGIDGTFCDQFVTYATEYEHDTYVDFLEKLQHFSKSK